jgi:protein-S-isoprenylcysteine O-methyltransferase Ste14
MIARLKDFVAQFTSSSNPRIGPLWPCLVLFVLFGVYWDLIAGRNAAPAKSSESRVSRLFHLVLVNGAILLLFLRVPGLTGRWLPVTSFLLPAGVVIQAAFILLAVWARHHLGRNWSGAVTAKVDHQLIRSGPYRLVRHPIYTAVLGMDTGIALASGEWHALVGIAMIVVAYWRKIQLEEQNLSNLFGADYDAYRRDSWALIPWLF